jgi:glutamyl-Q tRNA(Asp) synthetase
MSKSAPSRDNVAGGAQDIVTRFAPSPNGLLHLGHAYAAMTAHDFARTRDGRFLLRIEDIDGIRSRPEYIAAIEEDLRWLGLVWDGEVLFQSQRIKRYHRALEQLRAHHLVYRCFCSRGQIADAIRAQPVRHGPDGPAYPGTCRMIPDSDAEQRGQKEAHCWRLSMDKALSTLDVPDGLRWHDAVAGPQLADPAQFGDVVLWRKDAPASYHLAATVDDAADGITHVVRGLDLFAYTALHRLLQQLLNLPVPAYHHHPLLIDETGRKLAKSRHSNALQSLRQSGVDGGELINRLRIANFPIGNIRLSA